MGKTAVKERKSESAPADSCRHHWVIESPSGALSSGRCKLCGSVREFRNSANDYIWEDDSSSSGYGGWRRSRPPAKAADDSELTAAGGSGAPAALAM